MNAIQWMQEQRPQPWSEAATLVQGLDQPRARGRWEILRRFNQYRRECDVIIAMREAVAADKIRGYRDPEARQRAEQRLPGVTAYCLEEMNAHALRWGLRPAHPEAVLLFLAYEEPFESLTTATSALLLLGGMGPAKVRHAIEQWCEEFYSMQPDHLVAFDAHVVGPSRTTSADGRRYSRHLEIGFKNITDDQRKKLMTAVCGAAAWFEVFDADSRLTFKIALPGGPPTSDPFDLAAPTIVHVGALAKAALGIELPAVGPEIENRPGAIEKQISELDGGGTLGARVRRQVKIKQQNTLSNVRKRSKTLAP